MGREARVIAEIGAWLGEGKLLLETDELIFRGAKRHAVMLSDITRADVEDGWLTITASGFEARFDLGDYAEKWLHAIRNPRTRLDKFDIRSVSRVALVGIRDADFLAEVSAVAAQTTVLDPVMLTEQLECEPFDLLVLGAAEPGDLGMLSPLRAAMKNSGAIWVIHPKGRADLSHDAVMTLARPLGLIDVKSARFDDTHAALKLMLPRKDR